MVGCTLYTLRKNRVSHSVTDGPKSKVRKSEILTQPDDRNALPIIRATELSLPTESDRISIRLKRKTVRSKVHTAH